MDKITDGEVSLGPRQIWVGKEFMGTVEDMRLEVEDATKEAVETLQSAQVIRLVKIQGTSRN